jgi:CBS domain containing-hemolysin-like protein
MRSLSNGLELTLVLVVDEVLLFGFFVALVCATAKKPPRRINAKSNDKNFVFRNLIYFCC